MVPQFATNPLAAFCTHTNSDITRGLNRARHNLAEGS